MNPKKRLLISASAALMLSTAVMSSETLLGKEDVLKGVTASAETTSSTEETWSTKTYIDSTNNFNVKINGTGSKATEGQITGWISQNKKPSDLEIPDKLTVNVDGVNIDVAVTSIGESAFSNKNIKTVTIPASVKEIGESAFLSCFLLEKVSFADGLCLETIEMKTFKDCFVLKGITLPDSVKSVKNEAFEGCMYLSDVTLSDNIKVICDKAFEGCSGLKSIDLKSVEIIGEAAFSNTNIGGELIIPESVKEIGNNAFRDTIYNGDEDKNNIETLIIPETVESVGSHAFCGCNISELTINGSPVIENGAFSCSKITEVTINGSPQLGTSAFSSCEKLKNITIGENCQPEFGTSVFSCCANLTTINGQDVVIVYSDDRMPEINSVFKELVEQDIFAASGFWDIYAKEYAKRIVAQETTPEMSDVK